jgi:hypothetical protein
MYWLICVFLQSTYRCFSELKVSVAVLKLYCCFLIVVIFVFVLFNVAFLCICVVFCTSADNTQHLRCWACTLINTNWIELYLCPCISRECVAENGRSQSHFFRSVYRRCCTNIALLTRSLCADLSLQYLHSVSLVETGILDYWIQSKAVRIRCCIIVYLSVLSLCKWMLRQYAVARL